MLYSVDLLKIDGKFGVVWLLASSGDKKLKRKLTDRVAIRHTCKDIEGLLPVSKHHASLALASNLMFGTIRCHLLQARYLLKDIRSSRQCLRPKMISSMAIDLPIGFEDCLVDNVIEAVEAQEAAGEELRHTALTKRVLNARQITMTEHDLFKGQAFEDQGFGSLVSESEMETDILALFEEDALFPVIETTIQSPGRRGSDSDDGADLSVPGAPKNNHQPLPGERMDVTEMDHDGEEFVRPPPPTFAIPGSDMGESDDANVQSEVVVPIDQPYAPQDIPDVGIENFEPGGSGDMDFDDGQTGFVRDATPEPNGTLVEPRQQPDQQVLASPEQQPDQQVLASPEQQPDQQGQPGENQEQVEEDAIIPEIVVQSPRRTQDDDEHDDVVVLPRPKKRRRLKIDKEVKLSNAAIQENLDTYEARSLTDIMKADRAQDFLFVEPTREIRSETLMSNFIHFGGTIFAPDDADWASFGSDENGSVVREGTLAVSDLRQSVRQDSSSGNGTDPVPELDSRSMILPAPNGLDFQDDQGDRGFDLPDHFPDDGPPPTVDDSVLIVRTPEHTFLADDVTRHSTMRQDEDVFTGNRDTEKTKILKVLMRSRENEIFLSDILVNDDGGVVTSRQAAVAFGALLSLMAERRISAEQDEFNGPIHIQIC